MDPALLTPALQYGALGILALVIAAGCYALIHAVRSVMLTNHMMAQGYVEVSRRVVTVPEIREVVQAELVDLEHGQERIAREMRDSRSEILAAIKIRPLRPTTNGGE